VSYLLAIYYFLEKEYIKDANKWFTAREISKEIGISIFRTRQHLSSLRMSKDVEQKVEGWCNVYKFRNGSRKRV
jgi:predicted ArsR family transcriptional regulator